MTKEEITSLVDFARELNRRAAALRLSQAELSRRTAQGGAEVISQGYISDILRVGRGDSKKYFRLQRDKVVRLAQSVEWDVNEALDCAGFKGAYTQPDEPQPVEDRAAEAARAAELIKGFLDMPPERQAQLIAVMKILQTDRPELLKTPIEIVDASDLTSSDAKEID